MPELKGNSGLLLDGSVGVGDGLLPLNLGLGFLFLRCPFPLLVEMQVTPVVQAVKYAGRIFEAQTAFRFPCVKVDAADRIVLPAIPITVGDFFQAEGLDLLLSGRRDLLSVLLSDGPGHGAVKIVGPDLLQDFVPRFNILDLGQPVKIRERNLPAGNLFQLVLVQLHHFYAAANSRL